MAKHITVQKGRYSIKELHLHIDVTGDTFASQIRARPDVNSELIAEWTVSVLDAATGVVRLELDETETSVNVDEGFMDVKRVTGGRPVSCYDEILSVKFEGVTTE
jgi:hypothetical protein